MLCSAPVRADFVWGINGHPFNAYPGVSAEQQLDYVKDLGLTSYRVDILTVDQIPAMRRLFEAAKARGITLLPVITPPFDLERATAQDLRRHSYDLAYAIVSPFKGEIAVWELGNELENFAIIKACERRDDGGVYNCNFGPAGGKSSLDYYGPRWEKVSAVLRGLSEGSRAADPAIRRAIGTAGWGHIGAFERLQNDAIPFEISIWHQYGPDPEWGFKALAAYGRPIWLTEFNHPFGSQKGAVDQAAGLKALVARLRQLRRAYNVEAAYIYQLMDETYWAPDYEAYMGLVELVKDEKGQWKPGSPKPAYEAIKAAIAEDMSRDTIAAASGAPQTAAAPPPLAIERRCSLEGNSPAEGAGPVRSVIEYAYCLTLDREADGYGIQSWTDRLREGTSLENILVELIHSEEFAQTHAIARMSNAEYVEFLNNLLLDRPMQAEKRDRAVHDIETLPLSRADYQRRIINSDEFRSLHKILAQPLPRLTPLAGAKPEVRRICELKPPQPTNTNSALIKYSYCLVLGRDAEASGLNAWTQSMAMGLTIDGLILALLNSSEFREKYATRRLDNDDFVTLMYRLLLNREPTAPERDSYVSELAAGRMDRTSVAKSFVASDEFHAKQSVLFVADGQGHEGKPAKPR